MNDKKNKKTAKKRYQAPKLVKYGKVETLTQGMGSGALDCFGVSAL